MPLPCHLWALVALEGVAYHCLSWKSIFFRWPHATSKSEICAQLYSFFSLFCSVDLFFLLKWLVKPIPRRGFQAFSLCSEWITDSGVLNLGSRAPGCVSVPFLFIRELSLEWLIERWTSIVYNSNPPPTSGEYRRVDSGVSE